MFKNVYVKYVLIIVLFNIFTSILAQIAFGIFGMFILGGAPQQGPQLLYFIPFAIIIFTLTVNIFFISTRVTLNLKSKILIILMGFLIFTITPRLFIFTALGVKVIDDSKNAVFIKNNVEFKGYFYLVKNVDKSYGYDIKIPFTIKNDVKFEDLVKKYSILPGNHEKDDKGLPKCLLEDYSIGKIIDTKNKEYEYEYQFYPMIISKGDYIVILPLSFNEVPEKEKICEEETITYLKNYGNVEIYENSNMPLYWALQLLKIQYTPKVQKPIILNYRK